MDGSSQVSSKAQDWAQQTELVLVLWFRKGLGHGGGEVVYHSHRGRVPISPEGVGDFRPNQRDVLFSQAGGQNGQRTAQGRLWCPSPHITLTPHPLSSNISPDLTLSFRF